MKMRIGEKGLAIIKAAESLQLKRYICPAGKPTIGYGHVIRPNEDLQEITEATAEHLLRCDVTIAEWAVNRDVAGPLTQNQFDALVSLVFNIGGGNFRISTLLRLLNAGQRQAAADEFPKWCMAGGKPLEGLKTRRAKERALFLEA